jgi:hypothetical protein
MQARGRGAATALTRRAVDSACDGHYRRRATSHMRNSRPRHASAAPHPHCTAPPTLRYNAATVTGNSSRRRTQIAMTAHKDSQQAPPAPPRGLAGGGSTRAARCCARLHPHARPTHLEVRSTLAPRLRDVSMTPQQGAQQQPGAENTPRCSVLGHEQRWCFCACARRRAVHMPCQVSESYVRHNDGGPRWRAEAVEVRPIAVPARGTHALACADADVAVTSLRTAMAPRW